MKIVYISNSILLSRSANSIHVMKMCQAFADNGHEVVLISPGTLNKGGAPNSKIYSFYGVKDNFNIEFISAPSIRGWTLIYGFLASRRAVRLSPDLVYGRNIAGCTFSSISGLDVFIECHTPTSWLNSIMLRYCNRLNRLKKLIVITHSLKDVFARQFPLLSKKIEVLPDGADEFPENVKHIELIGNSMCLQVGYVGSLFVGKGMELISKLARSLSDIDFNIVGGADSDIEHWEKICKDLSNVHFYGHVPHSDVPGYIRAFDIMLLPNQRVVSTHGSSSANIGDWTSPLKAFEYMAAGKPIICSDLPVLREIFNSENAVLCCPDDVDSWASELVSLSEEIDRRLMLGNNAKAIFTSKFTWKRRAYKIVTTFQS